LPTPLNFSFRRVIQATVRIIPSQNSTATFNERRRHVRHKVPSIIYVGLGAGNGGIIINLAAGGLSLQAVAELNPETELTLHFQLEGSKQAIETEGRVTWLGPTQKEAGICFKNLVGDTEQQIAEWIARLEQQAPGAETEIETRPKPVPTSREAPVQPIQNSFQAISPRKKTANTRSNLHAEIPRESLSESSQLDDSMLRFRVGPEEGFASQLGKSAESHAEHSDPPLEPATPSIGAKEILPRDAVLPSFSEIISAGERVRAEPESSSSESRWRRPRIAISVVASIIGILALIVVVFYLGKPLAVDSGGQPAGPISLPAAVASRSAPRSGPVVRAGYGANSAPPIPATREAVSVPRDDGWVARLKDFLGLDVPTKIDPAIVNVPVWTIQRSGFYYCADSPDFEKLRQSAVMMTQGKALQSGYQPKLGSYCQ
jgi:PilZ domain